MMSRHNLAGLSCRKLRLWVTGTRWGGGCLGLGRLRAQLLQTLKGGLLLVLLGQAPLFVIVDEMTPGSVGTKSYGVVCPAQLSLVFRVTVKGT